MENTSLINEISEDTFFLRKILIYKLFTTLNHKVKKSRRNKFIIKNACAIFAIEGMQLSKENIRDGLDILNGKITSDQVIEKVLIRHGYSNKNL